MQSRPDDDRYIALLESALSQPDALCRDAFLDEACDNDQKLVEQIRDDVEWHLRMGDFLECPLVDLLDGPGQRFAAGDLVSGRFRIVQEVGEGGMAVVYEAIDEKLGERRALKCAHSGFQHRLPREANHALRVTHENICRVYEIHPAGGEAGSVDVLSMEFIEGETLFARLRRGRLDPSTAVSIARQLALGLAAAHREGVFHGDLKSTNVMLTKSASGGLRVVITDFGLANAGGEAGAVSSSLRGHPGYLAPERYCGAPSSAQSDIYSLGAILYEVVSGRGPFDEGTPLERRLSQRPLAPGRVAAGVARGWNGMLLRCLEPDPAKRFASVEELQDAIAQLGRWRWMVSFAVLSMLLLFGLTRLPAIHDRLFPLSPAVRLAIVPFTDLDGKTVSGTVLGGLEEVAASLSSLPGLQKKLLIIPVQASFAAGTTENDLVLLGATHTLSGTVIEENGAVKVRAAIKEIGNKATVQSYAATLNQGEFGSLPTALAGLVTSAFQFPTTVSARVPAAAAPMYWRAMHLLQGSSSDYDEAIGVLQQALRVDGNSPFIESALAEAFLQKYSALGGEEWLERAGAAANRAEALHPDLARVQQILSSLEQARGVPIRSLTHAERATQLAPDDTEAWRRLGGVYRDLGRIPEAIRAYDRAIAAAPGYYAPHQDLGFTLFRLGRYREAAGQYGALEALAPALPEELAFSGGILLSAGKDKEAEETLLRSLKIRETRAGLMNLGVLRIYQRQDPEAVQLFERAVRISPQSALALVNLADAQRRLARGAEADSSYRRAAAALLEGPPDAFRQALSSHVSARLRDIEGARRKASQAIRFAPADWQVVRWAVLCLESLGERQRALALLESAPAEVLDDLRRQPDLKGFSEDPVFVQLRKHAE